MTVRARTRLVFVLLAVAVVFMLVFEAPLARLIGVLALFGFVIAGVFAIADHDFLDPAADDDESTHGDAPVAGIRRAHD